MSKMSISRRFIKDDAGSAYSWQCSRRSHPVQPMGGVCAMCLTERLSTIARCGPEAHRPPPLTDHASCAYRRLAAPSHESMDSEGIPPIHMNMLTQGNIFVQQCDGVQDLSARHSSAGSEQSIASLIEREIVEAGRHRYSDVTAGFSILPSGLKELALASSNNERRAAACAKLQLARSRSYSTNSHFNSIHSTPASCKSKSSRLSAGDSSKPCSSSTDSTQSSNFRRCNTIVAAAALAKSSHHALLTKSKSTGSNYNGNNRHANKLRSPIHVWNLSNFWHKKCNPMEARYDSSSDDHSLVIVQPDDSVPFMKLPRSSSKNGTGAANCMNGEMLCLGKWLNRSTPSSFHLMRRCTLSGKGSSPTTVLQARHSSSACTQEPLTIAQDVAASSSSTTARSNCSPGLQVMDARIAKGVSVCGSWRLPGFNMSQKRCGCRASTIDYTPELGLGIISATNQSSASEMRNTFDDQYSTNLGGCKAAGAGASRAGHSAAALVSAHSQNVEEGGADNECIHEEGKTASNTDCALGVISTINHKIPSCDTADSSAASLHLSRSRGSGHLLNISSAQVSSFRSRVEYTPTVYSSHAMQMMHPSIMNKCQSIAALVSMDANLIHLV